MKRGKPLQRKTPLRRGSGLKRESPKHKAKRQSWAKLKARRIQAQREARGHTWCERCGRATSSLEFHHTEYAGRGGAWTDENGELICAWPEPESCHEAEHGRPFQPPSPPAP